MFIAAAVVHPLTIILLSRFNTFTDFITRQEGPIMSEWFW